MKLARTLGALLAATGCAPNPAFGVDLGATANAASTSAASTTELVDPTTEPTSAPDLTSGTGPDSSTTTTGLPVTTTGDDTTTTDATTGEFIGPHSCGQARDMGMVTSGLTKLAAPGGSIEVWCEQEVADGGWMLVARSVADAKAENFGWTHDLGHPEKYDAPYSLDVVSLGLPMSQILIGEHQGDNKPSNDVYALTVPPDFLTAYDDKAAPVTTIFRVEGDCDPQGGPWMLRYAGYTGAKDRFRLRDLQNDQNDLYGLRSDGFQLNYYNCWQGADLQDDQGVMFVR